MTSGSGARVQAIDLARRGISFRLIEKLEAPFQGSRGKGIQPRTQEVFEDLVLSGLGRDASRQIDALERYLGAVGLPAER